MAEIYPRTILCLIRNALEGQPHTPLLGMERYFGSAPIPEGSVVDWTPGGALDQKTHGGFVFNSKIRAWIRCQLAG